MLCAEVEVGGEAGVEVGGGEPGGVVVFFLLAGGEENRALEMK